MRKLIAKCSLFLTLTSLWVEARADVFSYHKATEDSDEVVKNKLFPKKGRLEIAGPDAGVILNQSYVTSYVLHGNINYYWSESLGLSLEGLYSINQDKAERFCIENFYNDINQVVGQSCPAQGQAVATPLVQSYASDGSPIYQSSADFGPAYVPIREINSILTGAVVWSPIYGKQLAFLSSTTYFDLFFTAGGGVTLSTFYPESFFLKNGKLSRPTTVDQLAAVKLTKCDENVLGGVCPTDPNVNALIGINGRPTPQSQTTPTITFGLGQKLHFLGRFNFKVELRNYTLVGTYATYENFFMLWGGFGVRF